MTNNGDTWDWDITGLTSDPDVFYVLKQGGADIASSSSQDNISIFPILFTESLPYTINNLSQEYTIELYDKGCKTITLHNSGETKGEACKRTVYYPY
tara:strand:- start:58 stop:348 length:291 start_codon:yes stop_codon:yes gene_type:complete